MKTIGLVGYPVSHSASKAYFEQKWRYLKIADSWQYKLWPIANITDLRTTLAAEPNLVGFNVTIPHKQAVVPMLHSLTPEAASIGAVNTVVIENGVWSGYNTDVVGVRQSLALLKVEPTDRALIFGTGGAARAVVHVLQKCGIDYHLVSRTPHQGMLGYAEVSAEVLSDHTLLVQTTPLGMWPDTTEWPLRHLALSRRHKLFDLVYRPIVTPFMRWGLQWRAHVLNGTPMLHAQADASWLLWSRFN